MSLDATLANAVSGLGAATKRADAASISASTIDPIPFFTASVTLEIN